MCGSFTQTLAAFVSLLLYQNEFVWDVCTLQDLKTSQLRNKHHCSTTDETNYCLVSMRASPKLWLHSFRHRLIHLTFPGTRTLLRYQTLLYREINSNPAPVDETNKPEVWSQRTGMTFPGPNTAYTTPFLRCLRSSNYHTSLWNAFHSQYCFQCTRLHSGGSTGFLCISYHESKVPVVHKLDTSLSTKS